MCPYHVKPHRRNIAKSATCSGFTPCSTVLPKTTGCIYLNKISLDSFACSSENCMWFCILLRSLETLMLLGNGSNNGEDDIPGESLETRFTTLFFFNNCLLKMIIKHYIDI